MSHLQRDEVGKSRKCCDYCGRPLTHPARGRARRYCADNNCSVIALRLRRHEASAERLVRS